MLQITVGTIIFGKAQFFLLGVAIGHFANWLAEQLERIFLKWTK